MTKDVAKALVREGLEVTATRELLNSLEEAQTRHVADQTRFAREVAEAG